MPSVDLEIDTQTALGAVLDTVIRKASLLDLTDFYIGTQADYVEDRLALFFTEEAKEETLKELEESIDIEDFSVTLESTEENSATWVLRLTRVAEGAASAGTTGEVGIEVPFSGTIDVKGAEEVTKGTEPE